MCANVGFRGCVDNRSGGPADRDGFTVRTMQISLLLVSNAKARAVTTKDWKVTVAQFAVNLFQRSCVLYRQEPEGMAKVQNEGVCQIKSMIAFFILSVRILKF